jgi:MFS family permease
LILSLLSRYTGSLTDRYGARFPLVLGPTIAAVGFAMFALPGVKSGSYWTTFFPAALVLGVGLALQAPAVTTVALNSVKASHSGLASAINNAFSQTAALLAIAVLGVLMFATFDAHLDDRLATLELPPAASHQLEEEKIKLGAAQAPQSLDAAQGAAVDRAIDEAYVAGYRTVMLVAAAMSLASAVSAALLIEGKRSEEVEGVHAEEELLPQP